MSYICNVIIIYSNTETGRLKYVLDFCFKSKGVPYEVTNSIEKFDTFEGLRINYSNLDLTSNLTIRPEGLLFEKDIRTKLHLLFDISVNSWLLSSTKDYFSIIFCFLTCYDEYLISTRDQHERIQAKDSILFKYKRLNKPNADIIVKNIWHLANLDYSTVQKGFKSIITFDIDSAWAVKNKGILRSLLGDAKLILKGKSVLKRLKIRKHLIQDPFDTFKIIKDLSRSKDLILFFLMSDWGKYDKNIHWKNNEFQSLIKSLKDSLCIGIHPSYQSHLN